MFKPTKVQPIFLVMFYFILLILLKILEVLEQILAQTKFRVKINPSKSRTYRFNELVTVQNAKRKIFPNFF